jgi:uncharacterized membrane protein YoaK (UPF0700 family)
MSAAKNSLTLTDIAAGTILISAGLAGLLVRLGVLNFGQAPQWTAFEQWWPLLVIIVGLVVAVADMECPHAMRHSGSSVEMRYGK